MVQNMYTSLFKQEWAPLELLALNDSASELFVIQYSAISVRLSRDEDQKYPNEDMEGAARCETAVMMEYDTWDPVKWLKANYRHQNGLPEFFTIAKVDHDQSAAENSYKNCVNILQDSDDLLVQEWAREVIRNNYMCLASPDVSSFWAAHYTMRNLVDNVVRAGKRKWTVITQESYKQDQSKSAVTKRQVLSRSTTVDELESTNVTGLSYPIGTHIKMLALAQIDHFDQLDDKSKYHVIIGMNGVLDLTDESEGSQLASLDIAQREELNKLRWDIPASPWMIARDVEFFNYLKTTKVKRNWKAAFEKTDARFRDSGHTSDRSRIYQICRHFLELHCFEPHLFSKDMVKNILSEADFIVKIWGRPLELLFRGSPLLTHW
ncbi:hypothetical protein BX666DRAFT_2028431 [Dichotomocladium elegans]|nr:hypothetical protein BX666DRAFT_2028431 [Dichotomocladium elegans]